MESKPQVTILETQKTKSSLKKDKMTLEDGKAWKRFRIPTKENKCQSGEHNFGRTEFLSSVTTADMNFLTV